MSIKNKHIIHYGDNHNYLCNRACIITPCKRTFKQKEVTCKNCLRDLKKGMILYDKIQS